MQHLRFSNNQRGLEKTPCREVIIEANFDRSTQWDLDPYGMWTKFGG
jgi:hypothetical protein